MTYYERLTKYGWICYYHAARYDYFKKGKWTVCVPFTTLSDPKFYRS